MNISSSAYSFYNNRSSFTKKFLNLLRYGGFLLAGGGALTALGCLGAVYCHYTHANTISLVWKTSLGVAGAGSLLAVPLSVFHLAVKKGEQNAKTAQFLEELSTDMEAHKQEKGEHVFYYYEAGKETPITRLVWEKVKKDPQCRAHTILEKKARREYVGAISVGNKTYYAALVSIPEVPQSPADYAVYLETTGEAAFQHIKPTTSS